MKVGIITICDTRNYGAVLQAFATQKAIESLGHYSEIIDYLYYKDWRFRESKDSAPFVSLSLKARLLYWIKYRIICWLEAKMLPLVNKNLRERNQYFKDFLAQSRFSSRFCSIKSLYKAQHDYDVFIAGSDQIWNYSADSSIEPYFLTFAPHRKRKFSYASSFGVSSVPVHLQKRYRQLLNNLDEISVREQSAVELVRELTGRKASLVLDPTLLLNKEQWNEWMRPVEAMPSKYILIYELMPSPALMELAARIGKESGLPIYSIAKRAYGIKHLDGVFQVLNAGPAQFLWLFAHASCVVTNSFHGTAFSVNFERPFCTVLNRNRKNNGRMTSLLKSLELLNRIAYEDEIAQQNIPALMRDIKTSTKLSCMKEQSLAYLRAQLAASACSG